MRYKALNNLITPSGPVSAGAEFDGEGIPAASIERLLKKGLIEEISEPVPVKSGSKKAELIEALEAKGITPPAGAKKGELQNLLLDLQAKEETDAEREALVAIPEEYGAEFPEDASIEELHAIVDREERTIVIESLELAGIDDYDENASTADLRKLLAGETPEE